MTILNRDALLKACSPESLITVEEDIDMLGGTVLIRELSAQQKMDSLEAAKDADTKQFNTALHNCIVMQMCVLDPGTKELLLSADDIPVLLSGRAGPVERIAARAWALSEAAPDHLKSGDSGPDERQQDAGNRAQTAGTRRGRSASAAGESGDD